jgi:hypothetical protein
MLTATLADRGKPIFAVGVPVAPGPSRPVDLEGAQQPEQEQQGGGGAGTPAPPLAAAASAAAAVDAAAADDDDTTAPLSTRLLTIRKAFMARINQHMGVEAAALDAAADAEEEEGE